MWFDMVTIEFLKTHALFGGIQDSELEKIRAIMEEAHFSEGEIIIKEGEIGDRLYFIFKGSVEVLKKAGTHEEEAWEPIAKLGEGDTFGEMELIDVQPRAATVKALEQTSALVLTNKDLYLIEKHSLKTFTIIIMNLAREISRRLRKMDAMVAWSLFMQQENSAHPHQ